MRRVAVAIVLGFALSGCSTTMTSPNEATSINPERVLKYGSKTSEADAHIVVTRDSGAIGSGCLTGFFINGSLVAKFDVRESANFYLPSGQYIFGYGFVKGRGLCAVDRSSTIRERETVLAAGETKRFRLFIDQDSNTDILPVSQK
ncbi:MAG: hypothetical protein WBD81_18470 [Collimonas pratensis]|uniref:hypothetical protein n=1 Tax=Collimonas pratensis TaxID=279113 RepID=UPI003C73A6DF